MLNIMRQMGPGTIGFSSLAPGSDQLFADICLRLVYELHVILPFAHYEEKLQGDDTVHFEQLLSKAKSIRTLDLKGDDYERAYSDAGIAIVDSSDVMIVVLDPEHRHGHGGTADIFGYAQKLKRACYVIDPRSGTISSPIN